MSKSAFNSLLNANIKDNNNKFVTPARHRTVLEALRDYIGWLSEINTWAAVNVFSGGTRRPAAHISGSGTVTISTTKNDLIIDSGVTQANLPASPTDGDWYDMKNAAGASVTLSGNGKNIFTSSNKSSITLIAGSSTRVYYDSTDDKWYQK